ncbi:HEAT repeat domain-containing protein [Streptomyces sp. NPDC006415]|uniref:HEAT repeat domain-containing protein n=1 Tax=Streptomyces sp. NPDC006415 TaxID=3155351 RepID=UPI0033A46347
MATPEQIWADADLPTRRLAGLALNPSVPESVLLRLLSDAPLATRMVLCRDRTLPDAVVDAVIRHPDTRTRSFFARNLHADPAQRARLVDDPEWFVRAHLAGPRVAAPARPRPLPDEAVVHMISTYEDELLGGSFYQQISAKLRRSMPTHPVAKVRRWGVGEWTSLSADTRAALLADPDAGVREAAQRHVRCEDPTWVEITLPDRPCHARTGLLLHCPLTRAVVEGVLARPVGEDDKAMIAVNPTLPADAVVLLAADPDPEVRARIAQRTDLGPAERRTLMTDPDPDVRLAVSLHPALSEEERAGIDYQVPMDHFFVYHPAPERPLDPGAIRRDALSRHPLLRRRAAGDHLLPPDLVARLASDDDLGVRVLLAQNHPDAPASLLLRSFLEYTGPERSHLTTRPNFPTDGLAVFADHEDPEVRALAARAPEAEPTTVARLTQDPDPAVRAAAARHPNLPQPRLAALLDDEESAHHAAANTALPSDTIRRLLQAGGRHAGPPG